MRHPFKKGQQVRCVEAKEAGVPIEEDVVYIVGTTFTGPPSSTECPIPGMEDVAGVTLVGRPNQYFRANRFQAVT